MLQVEVSTISEQEEAEEEKWREWLKWNIDSMKVVDNDFGLSRIASFFGKQEAVVLYWKGSDLENAGDVDGAIKYYKQAFRQWPALDSVTEAGLPREVSRLCREHGIFAEILIDSVDSSLARASSVISTVGLLNSKDLSSVEAVRKKVLEKEDILVNNPENNTHFQKVGTFLNSPSEFVLFNQAPSVVGKLLHFATQAWIKGNWSGTDKCPGPLHHINGGIPSLSIRVIEHWEYTKIECISVFRK